MCGGPSAAGVEQRPALINLIISFLSHYILIFSHGRNIIEFTAANASPKNGCLKAFKILSRTRMCKSKGLTLSMLSYQKKNNLGYTTLAE